MILLTKMEILYWVLLVKIIMDLFIKGFKALLANSENIDDDGGQVFKIGLLTLIKSTKKRRILIKMLLKTILDNNYLDSDSENSASMTSSLPPEVPPPGGVPASPPGVAPGAPPAC